MLNGIVFGMIDENEDAWNVSQQKIIFAASDDIAEPESYLRFNHKIVIGYSIGMADIDVVIVNAPNA